MFKRLAAGAFAAAMLLPAFTGAASTPAAAKGGPHFFDLDKAPKPKVTGKEIMAGLEDFVEKYPLRQNKIPNSDNVPAAEFLAKEAKKNGFKTRIIVYKGAGFQGQSDLRVVEAVKKGTKKPNDWIAFIAHYDTVASAGFTLQGAYDDGSGTNFLRYFGKAFKNVKTKKSIALLWFDGEEDGLLASKRYTDDLEKAGKVNIAAAMGFDMAGIGYPAPYCICVYHGPVDGPLAEPITSYVNFDYLGFPEGDGGPSAAQKWPVGGEGHVCNCGPNIRNSDESSFAAKGWFSMRWTGMRTASDYPGYHQPWDTIPLMEQVAGSRENLEQGMENTFKSAYYTTFVLDNLR